MFGCHGNAWTLESCWIIRGSRSWKTRFNCRADRLLHNVRLAHRSDAVTIICLRDNQILLQREYSYPVSKYLAQFPGGKIEENETPEEAAVRELKEESGFAFSRCEHLGWYYINNRRSDSKMYVVLAKDVTPTEKTGGDLEEEIDSFWVPLSKLREMISERKITNITVLAAWALLEKVL